MARFRLNPFRPQLKEGQRGTAEKRVLLDTKRIRLEAWHYNVDFHFQAERHVGINRTFYLLQVGYIEVTLVVKK